MPGWWNGIHEGLKILCFYELVGSNPTPGTLLLIIVILTIKDIVENNILKTKECGENPPTESRFSGIPSGNTVRIPLRAHYY
jgi:hypothetical protein